jgi:hypothetical protein
MHVWLCFLEFVKEELHVLLYLDVGMLLWTN